MQLACRDRNRLALEADLMGAAMHGIENISCMTGDDVTAGNEPQARRVFDLDSLQLIAVARVLESGRYLSGRSIGRGTALLPRRGRESRHAAVRVRVRRAAKKALAGARFLQLQICYRPELLERFMRAAHDDGLTERVAMIPSICILRTVGGMRFVATKVPGVDVPAGVVAPGRAGDGRRAGVLGDRATSRRRTRCRCPGSPASTSSRSAKTRASQSCAHAWAFRPDLERESNGYSASVAV